VFAESDTGKIMVSGMVISGRSFRRRLAE